MKTSLIIGYGSAGKNHEKILNKIGLKTNIFSRRKIKTKNYINSLNEVLENLKPQYVVIANETSEHYKTLCILENHNVQKIMIEKPIFHKVLKIKNFEIENIFVGYNLRFHPLILKLFNEIRFQKILSVDARVGSYLPDWRKGRDYKEVYSSDNNKGGGVLRDLSHEIDYLIWMFGNVSELVSLGGHFSSLSGDSEDIYKLILKMDRCKSVSLSLDYLNRLHQRDITVITDKNSYYVDLRTNTFFSSTSEKCIIKNFSNSKTYNDLHIDIIENSGKNSCTYQEAIQVLNVIYAAEKSNNDKKWIKI